MAVEDSATDATVPTQGEGRSLPQAGGGRDGRGADAAGCAGDDAATGGWRRRGQEGPHEGRDVPPARPPPALPDGVAADLRPRRSDGGDSGSPRTQAAPAAAPAPRRREAD